MHAQNTSGPRHTIASLADIEAIEREINIELLGRMDELLLRFTGHREIIIE